MISKKILIKEWVFYFLSKIVPGLTGFASVILFNHFIGTNQYGQYSFILSQWFLVTSISFGWLNQAELRYHINDINNTNYNDGQSLAFIFAAIITFILLLFLILFKSLSINVAIFSFLVILSLGAFNHIKIINQAKLFPKKILKLTFLRVSLLLKG